VKPFLPTDLEVHLITEHRVNPELIAEMHEMHGDRSSVISEISHEFMHSIGTANHEHGKDSDD
jgi:hypothetical protein